MKNPPTHVGGICAFYVGRGRWEVKDPPTDVGGIALLLLGMNGLICARRLACARTYGRCKNARPCKEVMVAARKVGSVQGRDGPCKDVPLEGRAAGRTCRWKDVPL